MSRMDVTLYICDRADAADQHADVRSDYGRVTSLAIQKHFKSLRCASIAKARTFKMNLIVKKKKHH